MRMHRRTDRGGVLILTAMLLPLVLLMTSFAVDLGRQRSARRTMQARADVIALDLARLIDGATAANTINYSGALTASALRNDVPVAKITSVQWGTLDAVTKKFIACSTCVPTAVKVVAADTVSYIFKSGNGSVSRSAVGASGSPTAAFTIGSFAARIGTGGNSVLALASQLTGLNAATTLVGFNGLANSKVGIGNLLAELAVGSPDDVATTTVTMGSYYAAVARVLNRSSAPTDLANAALLNGMVNAGLPSKSFNLGQLLDVTPGGGGAALDGSVNALDILIAGAQLANGVNGFEVNNLGLNLNNLGGSGLNLGSVQADLDIIQPPVLIEGPVGRSGRTDQVKTHLEAQLLGTGALLGNLVGANIAIDMGTATGTGQIAGITCAPSPMNFDVTANAGLLQTTITITLSITVLFVSIPITITVQKAPGTAIATQRFTRTDDPDNPDPATFTPDPREIQNATIGLSGASVNVTAAGLPVGILNGLLGTVTNTVLPILDSNLLGPLSNQLGVNVGGADLRPVGERCSDGVKLVG